MKEYANIIIDIAHSKVDHPFSYAVPKELRDVLEIGSCVEVPFGKGDAVRNGYIISFSEETEYDASRIKEIRGRAEGELPVEATYVRLAAWMRREYGSTMIQALRCVLPLHQRKKGLKHKYLSLRFTEEEARSFANKSSEKGHFARARILNALLDHREVRLPYTFVMQKLNVSASVIRGLVNLGVILLEEEGVYRDPVADAVQRVGGEVFCKPSQEELPLSSEQSLIIKKVLQDYDEKVRKTYLIHGITGSGKTEVYFRLTREMVKRGKAVILLIPEIALTFQTLMRFYQFFGNRVSVMNSSLSPGEKYDQFERARRGELDVMIGPRSALFTPFPNLGLIIMDEEHEPTYKSEGMPKYHTREAAVALAGLVEGGASVVLGSATPSLEAYDRAVRGEYHLFKMTRRLTGGTLPGVVISDMRRELKKGNRTPFSSYLSEQILDRLSKKEQIMLFMNRRGLAGFVSCRQCGYVFKCPHCDVSLSEHIGGRLVCHYCGYEQRTPSVCPSCGSRYLSAFRAGTQQIERACQKMFPQARVLRMDADTTRTKNSYEKILCAFANFEADILVGTQMIVKGHDFPRVTLVSALAADLSLNVGDFHAAERTFQLLTQASGRAGRGSQPGTMVIQTYQPDHYAILASQKQDYEAFFTEEMEYRRIMMYPPVAHLLQIRIFTHQEEVGVSFAAKVRTTIEQRLQILYNHSNDRPVVIGPAYASVSRVNDIYRMVVYVKHTQKELLFALRDSLEEKYKMQLEQTGENQVMMQFDLDPVHLF